MSWGEEWGDEPRKRRHNDPDEEARRRQEQFEANKENRSEQRQREKNDHYWARPRTIGKDRYQALMPPRPPGVQPIEHAASVARRQLGPEPPTLICGPCRSDHHENCLRVFHLNDGGEEVMCECSADPHWLHSGGR